RDGVNLSSARTILVLGLETPSPVPTVGTVRRLTSPCHSYESFPASAACIIRVFVSEKQQAIKCGASSGESISVSVINVCRYLNNRRRQGRRPGRWDLGLMPASFMFA